MGACHGDTDVSSFPLGQRSPIVLPAALAISPSGLLLPEVMVSLPNTVSTPSCVGTWAPR